MDYTHRRINRNDDDDHDDSLPKLMKRKEDTLEKKEYSFLTAGRVFFKIAWLKSTSEEKILVKNRHQKKFLTFKADGKIRGERKFSTKYMKSRMHEQ